MYSYTPPFATALAGRRGSAATADTGTLDVLYVVPLSTGLGALHSIPPEPHPAAERTAPSQGKAGAGAVQEQASLLWEFLSCGRAPPPPHSLTAPGFRLELLGDSST